VIIAHPVIKDLFVRIISIWLLCILSENWLWKWPKLARWRNA